MVTFLFSDIEGSTSRWEDRSAQMQAALRRHDELLRSVIENHGGYVFKTVGDEFCTAFADVRNAIAAALASQRAIGAEDWSAVDGLRVRMAIHGGLTDERNGDYYGTVVNRVARILATAHGGQVITSGTVADVARERLPPQASLRDLGSHRLRDLARPERLYQLVAPGLQFDFPPPRSLETRSNNLPVQLTSFIARTAEVAEIAELLEGAHLVTLIGAGGIGKTRTALQVAADALDSYPDGVWLVELAQLADPALVASAIAQVFNIEDRGGSRPLIDDVVIALKDKHALILLDNCEHLVAAAADAAENILRRCPNIKMLATSREPLGIAGEQSYRMPSLAVPPITDRLSANDAMEYGAVALFVARAHSVQEKFILTDSTAPIVAEIVRRLDGIALAIELAAPRINVLSIEQLAQRLDERFKILTGGSRTALPRQQTLRAMIDWSYDLLSEAERSLLRQLAIFRGGCTLEAVSAVCIDDGWGDDEVLSLLSALVDKSLVVTELQDDKHRYQLLESTRQYSQERLQQAGDLNSVAARHSEHYRALAEQLEDEFWTTNTKRWFQRARGELENYRAAIDWGLVGGNAPEAAAAIVASLRSLWFESFRREGRALVARALDSFGDNDQSQLFGRLLLASAVFDSDSGRGAKAAEEAVAILARGEDRASQINALRALAACRARGGNVEQALHNYDEALALARTTRLPTLIAQVASEMGGWVSISGDSERGRVLLEEALAIDRSHGDRQRMATVLTNLGELRFAGGDVRGALENVREAETIARELGSEYRRMATSVNMAAYLLALDERADAWARAREGLELALGREQTLPAAMAIGHLAQLAVLAGKNVSAARLNGYVDAVYARQNAVREPTEQRGRDKTTAMLRDALTENQLAALLAEGASMDEATAVAEAMAVPQPHSDDVETA